MDKAGIWIRVSTEDQAKGDTTEIHEKRARHYAEFNNWEVETKYDLSGVSGKTIINHPEAKRMMSDIASGKITGIIFSKLARLARNTKELIEISEFFQKHNAHLISLEEKIDTSSPVGKFFFTLIAALAQWEREEISSRVAASIPTRARLGKPTGGRGPFGYQWKDKKLVINPEEASVVREVFDTFLTVKKFLVTTNFLNGKGLRLRNNAKFGKTTVKRILTDSVYKGLKRANYSKSKGNKKSWKLKDKKDWVFFEVEPIISPDKWEAINNLIKQIGSRYPSEPLFLGKYAFSGLLRCSCGSKMYAYYYKGVHYSCKKCRLKLTEPVLTQHLKDGLQQISIHPEQLMHSTEQEDLQIQEKEILLTNMRQELSRIPNKTESLIYRQKNLSDEDFKKLYASLKETDRQLQTQIPQVEQEVDHLKMTKHGRQQLLTHVTDLSTLWDSFNEDTRIKLIKELVNKVTVSRNLLTFEYFYLPNLMSFENSVRNHRDSSRQPTSATQGR